MTYTPWRRRHICMSSRVASHARTWVPVLREQLGVPRAGQNHVPYSIGAPVVGPPHLALRPSPSTSGGTAKAGRRRRTASSRLRGAGEREAAGKEGDGRPRGTGRVKVKVKCSGDLRTPAYP